MSDLPLCVIAAPYGDPSPTIRAWHVARARLLARLALACGYAPIEPHSSIAAGVYGDDSDPEQRARGMAATAAICRGVIRAGGEMWALRRDDGTMSDGTAAEWAVADAFRCGRTVWTWAKWREVCEQQAPDLLPEWDRLAVRPTLTIGPWEHIADVVSYRHYDGGRALSDIAARVAHIGWAVYRRGEGIPFAHGPETGAQGRAAADAALRRAGVMG